MRITIMPRSSLGWWCVGLVISIVVLFVVIDIVIVDVEESYSALERGLAAVFAAISAAALATGLIGVFTRGERSILVFLTTAIGLFAFIIAVGQAFGKTIGW